MHLRPTLYACRMAVLAVCLPFLLAGAPAQEPRPRRLCVMEWNVENLFDTAHDAGFHDEDFLPAGSHHWTGSRLWRKVNDIARVVAVVADSAGTPDLIGLCEVENDSVLTLLTRRSAMRHLGYEYIVTHSADARGIDVALLYQPVHFRLLSWHAIRVNSRSHGLPATRDLLYARGLAFTRTGIDTLHVFVAHLPSRSGGRAGDSNRRLAAQTLWQAVDSVQQLHARAHIVVMGDFNAGPRDRLFRHAPLRLTDAPHDAGTYCYRGVWQWLDHILVSESVGTPQPARSLRLPWLLEPGRTYGTDMPRRTYRGPAYHGGVSDHLPLTLTIEL